MAVIRRNAKWLSAAALLFVTTLAGWWLLSWHAPVALAQETYTPLDPAAAAQLDLLRREIGTDDDALGALDPSSEQAESVLAAVRSWYETNAADLQTRRLALGDQRALVRHYLSEIRQGQDMSTELAAARTTLAQTTANYESYIAGARQAVDQELSTEQSTLVDRMQAQEQVPMPFRVLDLTALQRTSLAQARTAYHKRLATAEDSSQRAQLRAAYEQEVSSILGPTLLQELETLQGYLGSASERVVAAIDLVLPVADEG